MTSRGAETVCTRIQYTSNLLFNVYFLIQAVQAYYRGEVYEAKRKNSLSKRCTISSIVIGAILYIVLLINLLF